MINKLQCCKKCNSWDAKSGFCESAPCTESALEMIEKINQLETELEEYRKNELIIKLPVSLGTTVYKISTQRDNFDDREYLIIIQVPFRLELLPHIGKFVFLTYKDAEKVLKGTN